MVTSSDRSTLTVTNYKWNIRGCLTNTRHSTPTCFPTGQTTQSVTGYHLLAEDAGTITCTVTIGDVDYISGPLTLRISGIQNCIQVLLSEKKLYMHAVFTAIPSTALDLEHIKCIKS